VVIDLKYSELLGRKQMLAAVQNLLEHRLRVAHRTADDLKHLSSRPLLFVCLSRFTDKLRVFALQIVRPERRCQRKRRMRGQRGENTMLTVVKAAKVAFDIGVQVTDAPAGSQRRYEATALFAPSDTLRPVPESCCAGTSRFLQPRGDCLQQVRWRLSARKARRGNAWSTGFIDDDEDPLSTGQFDGAFDCRAGDLFDRWRAPRRRHAIGSRW
jgi:hypothetical protein